MSATIGYRCGDKVIFLTDTLRGIGRQKFHGFSESASNVWRSKNGILVAHGGERDTFSVLQSLRDLIEGFGEPLSQKLLVKEFIPAYVKAADSAGFLDKVMKKNGKPRISCNLLFASGADLFLVDMDFSVYRIDRYALIGTGWGATVYGMQETAPEDPEETVKAKMISAMRDATLTRNDVRPPFLLFETGKEGYEMITEVEKC